METVPLSGRGSKLVALVLIVIVVVSGLGYWIFSPRVPDQTVSTTHQSSLTTSIGQTAAGSTASTSIVSETTQWINVRAAKPVSYYLSLLKSSGTQPYVQLA